MFVQCKNEVFSGQKEKESIICVRMGLKKFACDHRLSSFGKPHDVSW